MSERDELTKLDFSRLDGKIYGHEKELSAIREVCLQVSGHQSSPEQPGFGVDVRCSRAIFVSGPAGVGKKYLIERALNDDSSKPAAPSGNGIYKICGEFDQEQSAGPYSAINTAFDQLCDQILSADDQEIGRIKAAIEEKIGSDYEAIAPVVPKLRVILEDDSDDASEQGSRTSIGAELKDRFNFVFRAFVQAVCSQSQIVVLHLDGLQWADVSSIDLITSLLTDHESRNLLFIGSFRDDGAEIDRIREVEKKGLRTTTISLANLDKETTNSFLSDLLRLDDEMTPELAGVLHQKTHGNMFYMHHFLEAMREEGLLYFSLHDAAWAWVDTDKIRAATVIMGNVVDIVLSKLWKLPGEIQHLMGIAAYLGSNFTLDLLAAVTSAMANPSSSSSDTQSPTSSSPAALVSAIDMAVENGVLERSNAGQEADTFRFTHDQLKQAASSLLLEDARKDEDLHLCIGETLWARLISSSRRGNYELLFATVNHLNQALGCVEKEYKQVSLAKINLKAGQIAAKSSAFIHAAGYFTAGIQLLDFEHAWNNYYDLCYDLHCQNAKTANCLGDFDACYGLVDEIVTNAKSVFDEVRARYVRMDAMAVQGKNKASIKEGLRLLSLLGVKLPSKARRPAVAASLLKTKFVLRNLSNEDLMTLPLLSNERMDLAMLTLERMFRCTIIMRSDFIVLVVCRMVRITVKHGISRLISPSAFMMYALMVSAILNDLGSGYRYGQLALRLQENFGSAKKKVTVLAMYYGTLSHWREQLQASLEPLLLGYKLGMRVGETENAMVAATMYCSHYLCNGLPLTPLEQDLENYQRLAVEYNTETPRCMLLPFWQYVLNLRGCSDNPLLLSGKAMDDDELLRTAVNEKNMVLMGIMRGLRMELAYMFDRLDLAITDALFIKKFGKRPIHFLVLRQKFFAGLVFIGMAQKNRKKRWRVHASALIKDMKSYVRRGEGNILHMVHLLEAENGSMRGDARDIKRGFDTSIAAAGKMGLKHDQALANERAGNFFLEAQDDYWAYIYLSKSCELYSEWGAVAKANHLRKKHALLSAPQPEYVASASFGNNSHASSYRGRQRYTNEAVCHSSLDFLSSGRRLSAASRGSASTT